MVTKSIDSHVQDEREDKEGDDDSVEVDGDSEESYTSGVGDEEVHEYQEVTDEPEWDKDSFDGREYHSSDDQREYEDKDFERRARFYRRTVIETKGFFEATDEFPPYLWAGIATLPGLDDDLEEGLTVRQFLANMTSLCLDKYNKHKGFNVKLEHVLRANFDPGGSTTYYITFAARESDSPGAPLVEYQAKVAWSGGKTYPILCRPTSPPKMVEGDGGDQLKEVAKVMEESS
ncbi:Cystatin-related plant [Arabidopsis suecica]|uniref:Cystatin-related plant n=1 Tax=Arabidopsis suecica TaxID=45249 RepID=A0A8T2B3M5_ARASU|nr:Cystatin-related plant [Arabidopsis suecica]